MRFVKRGIAMAVLLLASCSGQSDQNPQPQPSPQVQTTISTSEAPLAAVEVVVNTRHHECNDDLPKPGKVGGKPGACYLPLYTRPGYNLGLPINSVVGSKCTPQDESQCWPQPETKLIAICQVSGETIRDRRGISSAIWYGVVVPPAEILRKDVMLPTTQDGRKVGFAPKVWLGDVALPACGNQIPLG